MSFLNAFFGMRPSSAGVVLPPPPPAGEVTTGPPLHYLNRDFGTGLAFPGVPGAKAVSFWVQRTENTSSGFLVDMRVQGWGYWWNLEPPQGMSAWLNTSPATQSGYPAIAVGYDWVRVVIHTDSLAYAWNAFCRLSENEFFAAGNVGAVRIYSRQWTADELANPTLRVLANSVLATYEGTFSTSSQLLDTSGNNYHARLIGPLENYTYQ